MHVRSARWTVPALLLAGALALTVLHGCTETPSPTESAPAARLRPATAAAASQGQWGASYTDAHRRHSHAPPAHRARCCSGGTRAIPSSGIPPARARGLYGWPSPFEIFCSGHTLLPDGRLLAAGGNIDRQSSAWPRWRSSTRRSGAGPPRLRWRRALLPDDYGAARRRGAGGRRHRREGRVVSMPEIWNGSAWRPLTGASLDRAVLPVDVRGAQRQGLLGRARSDLALPERRRHRRVDHGRQTPELPTGSCGSAVMYAPGKILYAGGGDPPTASAEVIDLNQPVAGMAVHRPDGLRPAAHERHPAAPTARCWSPTAPAAPASTTSRPRCTTPSCGIPPPSRWTTHGAGAHGPRTYHSTALLLPDATGAVERQRRGRRRALREQPVVRAGVQSAVPVQPRRHAGRPALDLVGPSALAYGQTVHRTDPGCGDGRSRRR